MNNGRNSNLELLRIVAMLMIVANHFAVKGGLPWRVGPGSALDGKLFFSQFLASFGKFGADIFVLISAWFMAGKPFRAGRVVRVWLMTVVAGVVVLALLPFAGRTVHVSDWVRQIFPMTRNAYWFVTAYIPFIALIPFVHDVCSRLSSRAHGFAAAVLLLFYSVVPTVLGPCGFGTKPLYGYSELLWFLVLGVLAGYLRRTVDVDRLAAWKPIAGLLASCAVVAVYTVTCDMVKVSGGTADWALWRHANSIFIVVASTSILLLFAKLRLGTNRMINSVSACVFGVYLIHDHPKISYTLWRDWVGAGAMYRQDWYCLRAFGAILLVFVASLALSYFVNMILSLLCRLIDAAKKGAVK